MFSTKTCLAITLFASLAIVSNAHLTMLCSATSAKRPGDIDFYFGTYHQKSECGNKPCPGNIKLTNTGGTKVSAKFSENYVSRFTISTVDDVKQRLIKSINNPSIIDNSYAVNCYTTAGIPANRPPPKDGGAWIVPAPLNKGYNDWGCTDSGGSFKTINMFSRVPVKQATSGDWKFEMSGTNDVYNPHKDKQLCALSTKNPRWIGGMSVADGTPPCKGSPPVPSTVDAKSVAKCDGTIGGAVCTGFTCSNDLKDPKAQGEIKCDKSKWVVTAKCTGDPKREKGKCELVAETSTQTVETSVNNMQVTINNMADGSKCPAVGQDQVNKAKKDHADAVARYTKSVTDVTTAASASVKIGGHTFSSLDGTSCNQFFTTSSYTNAHTAYTTAVATRTKYEAEVKAFKKAHDEAIATQKVDQRKCQCTVRHNYNAQWVTATTHNKNNCDAWKKAWHLICVHRGDLTINAGGTTTGKCSFPACPQVTGKTLHISVSVLKATDCVKGKNFEAEVEEFAVPQGQHVMLDGSLMDDEPGMHMMPDGSMMRDEDMY